MTFALASPGGWGPNAIKQAGGHAAPRRVAARFSEAGALRFWPRSHAGHEKKDADTHVESHDDVLSDAGSTPAASTNQKPERRSGFFIGVGGEVSQAASAFGLALTWSTPAASKTFVFRSLIGRSLRARRLHEFQESHRTCFILRV